MEETPYQPEMNPGEAPELSLEYANKRASLTYQNEKNETPLQTQAA